MPRTGRLLETVQAGENFVLRLSQGRKRGPAIILQDVPGSPYIFSVQSSPLLSPICLIFQLGCHSSLCFLSSPFPPPSFSAPTVVLLTAETFPHSRAAAATSGSLNVSFLDTCAQFVNPKPATQSEAVIIDSYVFTFKVIQLQPQSSNSSALDFSARIAHNLEEHKKTLSHITRYHRERE